MSQILTPEIAKKVQSSLGFTMTQELLESFLSNIEWKNSSTQKFEEKTCVLWKGQVNKSEHTTKASEHGTFYIPELGKNIGAHLFMFAMTRGIPPPAAATDDPCPCEALGRNGQRKQYGSCCKPRVHHICHEKTGDKDIDGKCINPHHLKLALVEDIQRDIRVRDNTKSHGLKGENNQVAKYSEALIREIWAEMQQRKGEKGCLKKIAEARQVPYNLLKDLNCGKRWNFVTGLPEVTTKKRQQRKEAKYQANKKARMNPAPPANKNQSQ